MFAPFQFVEGVQLVAGAGQRGVMTATYNSLKSEGVTLSFVAWVAAMDTRPAEQQTPMRIIVGKKFVSFEFQEGRNIERGRSSILLPCNCLSGRRKVIGEDHPGTIATAELLGRLEAELQAEPPSGAANS
jgi:hypothetical protein